MSKNSHNQRHEALQGWIEQTKKSSKYGKPKRKVVYDEDIDEVDFKHNKVRKSK